MSDTKIHPRYTVEAFHKQGPNLEPLVDYWRVVDGETGMRANGTAKYETPEQALRWCESLNAGVRA